MALFPLGILSAAGAGGETYELIASNILGTATSEVVFDFSSLASAYKHLQIRTVARTNRAGDDLESIALRLNTDTSANYAWHALVGRGDTSPATVISENATSQTSMRIGLVTGSTATANAFSPLVIDVLDSYATTKNKTVRILSGVTANSPRVYLSSGLWINTASVTSATLLTLNGGSFIAGSRFSLYGIKG